MATWTYDDTKTLSANKSDGGAATDTTKATATEWNTAANALLDLRSDMRAGDYHGLKNMASALPPLSGSGETRLASNAGQLVASSSGGPYIWIKAVDYINLADKRFGAALDGTTDDTAAFELAVNTCVFGAGNSRKRVLALPNAQIRLRSPANVGACLGFVMIGQGKWATELLIEPTGGATDGIVIEDSQHVTLEGFRLVGNPSLPAGKMLFFNYVSAANASYGHHIRSVYISASNRMAYDYGIYFSDAYGNNSEVVYNDVHIERFREAGIALPGSQQKAHNLHSVFVNGDWDGVAHSTNGGKYAITTRGGTGGSFQWWGGGASACSITAFDIANSNDPFIIHGVNSELCNSIMAPATGAVSSTQGLNTIEFRGCRFDVAAVHNTSGVLQYSGVGQLTVECCDFDAGGANFPKVRIVSGGNLHGIRIVGNQFKKTNSVAQQCIIADTGVTNRYRSWEVYGNSYRDSAGGSAWKDELLDITVHGAGGTALSGIYSHEIRSLDDGVWGCEFSQFTANASSHTIELHLGQSLPKAASYLDFFLINVETFTHSGGATVTLKVGTTSGGDELLKNVTVSGGSDNTAYGINGDAYVGTNMVSTGRPYMPAWNATHKVYVTVTVSTGTVGNGTVSNLTRGKSYFPALIRLPGRFNT